MNGSTKSVKRMHQIFLQREKASRNKVLAVGAHAAGLDQTNLKLKHLIASLGGVSKDASTIILSSEMAMRSRLISLSIKIGKDAERALGDRKLAIDHLAKDRKRTDIAQNRFQATKRQDEIGNEQKMQPLLVSAAALPLDSSGEDQQ